MYMYILFAQICCGSMFISNVHPPQPYINKNRRTLQLSRTRGRLELTIPPYIESRYLLANDALTKRLASKRQVHSWCESASHFLTTHTLLCASIDNFMIFFPAKLSHYELHSKPHETVTDHSAIAVSLACSTAGKGGV